MYSQSPKDRKESFHMKLPSRSILARRMDSDSLNCTSNIGSSHNWTCFIVHYETDATPTAPSSTNATALAILANLSRAKFDDFDTAVDGYDGTRTVGLDPAYQLRYGLVGTVLLSVAYTLVFIVGLLGNFAVVIVVKKSTMMRSPTNRFIVNLAYADLLVNFLCLPFTLIGNLYPEI
ncbi:g-protein coupled receptor [Culex quinquefasciatus]|uniref:G-protein coupled receptor n=1 Tax=Culex quinquefasciatus TaxID=7176 RepID=B0WYV8_CULQU|nr:g-protein coupled receptor [Culex quinquefasciatus]|eukprot:XP_001862580.1 g-protein coupled receptor [Culex quinquefasciatus]